MFKNIKKIVLALIFACLMFFVISCTEEQKQWTKEQCIEQFGFEECSDWTKEQCEEKYPAEACPEEKDWTKEQCAEKYPAEACPDWTKEQCEEKFPAEKCPEIKDWTKEQCSEKYPCPEPEDPTKAQCEELFGKYLPQEFAVPTAFEIYGDIIGVGDEYEIIIEELEPENAIDAFLWSSSDESIATVSQTGVVKGVRPGKVLITATSIYDETVTWDADFDVSDPELDALNVVSREKAALLAAIPQYSNVGFAFPKPWNTSVVATFLDPNGVAVESFELPAELAADTEIIYTLNLEYGDATDSATVKIGAVLDKDVNDFARVNTAAAAAEAILKNYILGELVSADLVLPATIFGVPLGWSSDNTAVLDNEGLYVRPLDDKVINYTITPKYGVTSKSTTFKVVAKGYNADEKVESILTEGSLASIANGQFNTSLVFPKQDAKFGVDLVYVSENPAIFDNDGNLVAAPAEATEVKFNVTASYNRSGVAENNFEAKAFSFVVTALPATGASAAAEAFAAEFKLDSELWFPYGEIGREGGNTLQVPTKYTHNEVEYAVEYVVDDNFELVEGVPTLVTQFLRYNESRILVKLTAGEDSASFEALLNVGINNEFDNALLSWRNSEQKDTSLTPASGLYDVINTVSYFDKYVGNTSRKDNRYWSEWSGYTLTAEYNGVKFTDFIMAAMVCYIYKDAEGKLAYYCTAYSGGYTGQTNWGKFFVNLTGEDVKVAVGTYASGTDVNGIDIATYGSRDYNTFDGYAIGFVCDKDGNVSVGSEEGKFQSYIDTAQLAYFTVSRSITDEVVEMREKGDVYLEDFVNDETTPANLEAKDYYKAPYATIPADGFGCCWKYQFYGVGNPAVKYGFTKAGTQIDIKQFNLHPLNSVDALCAKEAIDAIDVPTEKNIANARKYYDRLVTEEEKAYAGDIVAKEQELAADIDELIEAQLLETEDPEYNAKLSALYARVQALTPAISKFLTKTTDLNVAYEKATSDAYVITLDYLGGTATVDGVVKTAEETTEKFSKVFYYPSSTEIVLPVAVKENYVFLGWFSDAACTTPQAVTAETAADVTLYAGWIHTLNQYINKITPEGLTQKFYQADPEYKTKVVDNSTFGNQYLSAGFGNMTFTIGSDIYFLGQGALIELNSANFEGRTALTTEDVKAYGRSPYSSNSEGLIRTSGEIAIQDTYGYGSLLKNTGEDALTFKAADTYGRNLGGPNYGYDRILLTWNEEKSAFVSSAINASSGEVTLQPGDYLWCPFYAERMSYGLTNCNGTSGTVGVLVDGTEVLIRSFAELEALIPVPECAFNVAGINSSVWGTAQSIIASTDYGKFWVKVGINKVGDDYVVAAVEAAGVATADFSEAFKSSEIKYTVYPEAYADSSKIAVGQIVKFINVDLVANTLGDGAKIEFWAAK